jgi:hypothetical protein
MSQRYAIKGELRYHVECAPVGANVVGIVGPMHGVRDTCRMCGGRLRQPPVQYDTNRAESDPCERGTVGCPVLHGDKSTECTTW